MNRRHFTHSLTGSVLAATIPLPLHAAATEEIIDIHQHTNYHGRRNDALLTHQQKMGITRTILLPAGTELTSPSTHLGKSNGLAGRVFGTEASARLAEEHPTRFVFFCNEVPDANGAIAVLEKWLDRGAIGIGESKFALDCDSAPMRKIYDLARAYRVPVLLHFEHEKYNFGFDRFHKILEQYPEVNFIGHAQTWWGNIDAAHDQKVLYPEGTVTPGGITDRYLSDYPNMFGDLSAGSGLRALSRDEDHARDFLTRHQDKLLLGTDCPDSEGQGDVCSGAKQIAQVRRLAPDDAALTKIFSGNAKRIMKLT
jgi:predicted TIM-barrel fold metal-dependent hydrolase